MWFGFGLVLAGILLLLSNLGILSGDAWDYIWPAAIILLGLSMLMRREVCCPPKAKKSPEESKKES